MTTRPERVQELRTDTPLYRVFDSIRTRRKRCHFAILGHVGIMTEIAVRILRITRDRNAHHFGRNSGVVQRCIIVVVIFTAIFSPRMSVCG